MTEQRHIPTEDSAAREIARLFLRFGSHATVEAHPAFSSGLTVPQLRVLFTIRRGGIRPSLIAQRTHTAPPNVTAVLDRLEERGLVSRQPDPADGRATIVVLTDAGRALVRSAAASYSGGVEHAVAGMTEDEIQALRTGLAALVREMDEAASDAEANRSA